MLSRRLTQIDADVFKLYNKSAPISVNQQQKKEESKILPLGTELKEVR